MENILEYSNYFVDPTKLNDFELNKEFSLISNLHEAYLIAFSDHAKRLDALHDDYMFLNEELIVKELQAIDDEFRDLKRAYRIPIIYKEVYDEFYSRDLINYYTPGSLEVYGQLVLNFEEYFEV